MCVIEILKKYCYCERTTAISVSLTGLILLDKRVQTRW